jgi:hypothetical protein
MSVLKDDIFLHLVNIEIVDLKIEDGLGMLQLQIDNLFEGSGAIDIQIMFPSKKMHG